MTPSMSRTVPGSWRVNAPLAAILLLGAALRCSGLAAGAPFRMGVDEPVVLGIALQIVRSGDFNPHFFDYGGLTFYLHAAIVAVGFLKGAMDGAWGRLDQVWIGDFLVTARTTTALLGTLTILVVFHIGRRWGTAVALVSALLVAVLSAHVRESHFALTDVPLTLLVATTLLLSLRAAEARTLRALLLAGACVGLTTAIKYNGALVLVMPLIAAAALPGGRRLTGLLLVPVAAALGFLLAAPYSLLDLPAFLNGVAHLMQSYNHPRPITAAAWTYLGHLRNWFSWQTMLPLEVGWIALAVGLVGTMAIARGTGLPGQRLRAAILLVFPLLYFWFISHEGSLQYGRYLLPVVPMLAVSVATGTVAVAGLLARRLPAARRLALPLVVLLLLAPPTAAAIDWDIVQGRVTTTDQAAAWISAHATPAQPIVVEDTAAQLPPRLKSTQVHQLIDKTVEQYRAEGTVYLVASEALSSRYFANPVGRAGDVAAYAALLRDTQLVATFAPSRDHPGPGLRILKVP
jgi:4-amino-4-deoxy-L-arabinose transferase-like glycosyltransferase